MNPAHLELGTIADNNRDRVRDGTSNRGEKHPLSKFTEQQIRDIRASLQPYRRGLAGELAREYGVTANAIHEIRKGIRWGFVVS